MFKVLGEVSKANFRTSAVGLRKEYFLHFWGSWQDPMRGCPGGHRAPGDLVGLQGQLLQSTGAIPSNVREEQARQKASTEEANVSD